MTQTILTLPNVRKIFVPDPGYMMFDADLSGADAQVVAWEAEDEDLMNAFRSGIKIHVKNAEDIFGSEFTKAPGDIKAKGTPKGQIYDKCKRAVHATNYGAAATTLSRTPEIAWTVHRSTEFQKRWFSIHPGIKKNFHGRVEAALRSSRTVKNAFGYHRIYFDRIQDCFSEALAWIPQSTVALVTYAGASSLQKKYPQVQFLLQVHDSLVFQIKKSELPGPSDIKEALKVPVPYANPLYIPWGLAMSDKSWGDCASL